MAVGGVELRLLWQGESEKWANFTKAANGTQGEEISPGQLPQPNPDFPQALVGLN
jgi:hypothetical protein